MNPKDNKNFTRVIHREYTDPQGNIRTEYKDIKGNIYTEYRDSQGNFHTDQNQSVNGKLADAHIQDVRVEHADKNISKGLLIGVIVTTVAGLIAGVIYFLNDVNNPQPISVINIPAEKPEKNDPSPPQIKVVEKEVVKIVPVEVPVQTSPTVVEKVPEAQNNPSTVNNNITVKPSESNPPPKESSTKTPAAKPAQNPTPSPTKPVVIPLSNDNAIKNDGDLKNEILKQFKNNLPNNQLKVDVKTGVVIVSGNVDSQEQMQKIEPLLKSVKGIKKLEINATIANGVTN
ncbi:MAG: BON domain-containing protein [Cyanobacteria bacterium]|nr:BON domain-containing protein [Cyanobacteria bacterium CG_2015-16_32_12]NCO77610.1 BON domain-containing protein [Cyanobacteria bacterium CG_2015-22_32_23]NCQ03302.1 BON domain-containing protein [Cyanobacteria bacterium CG_2015-09_32_10]NCQ41902.1 BON domain-containing protein [Cyanobacteria bacterium CG_2015-04_32_10]NCS83456.1 BON domain-containing protein [Cyanobacteria bacterium CG_2015-02_32_10]